MGSRCSSQCVTELGSKLVYRVSCTSSITPTDNTQAGTSQTRLIVITHGETPHNCASCTKSNASTQKENCVLYMSTPNAASVKICISKVVIQTVHSSRCELVPQCQPNGPNRLLAHTPELPSTFHQLCNKAAECWASMKSARQTSHFHSCPAALKDVLQAGQHQIHGVVVGSLHADIEYMSGSGA